MASLPAPEKSYDERLAEGLAAWLAARGILSWDGGPDGAEADAYAAGVEWPTYIGPDAPAGAAGLTTRALLTPITTTAILGTANTVIQVWLRGPAVSDAVTEHAARAAVSRKAEQIRDALYPHGRPLVHTTFGDVRIGGVFPLNGSLTPRDADRRYSHVANYRFRGRRV